jgi:molybdate transport system substrate-binding protein
MVPIAYLAKLGCRIVIVEKILRDCINLINSLKGYMQNIMSFQLRKGPVARLFSTTFLLMLGFFSSGAIAAELKLMASTGVYSVMQEVIPGFEAKTGAKVIASYDTSNIILKRVQSGESADLIILTRSAIDNLVRQGTVASNGVTDLAVSGVGMVVRSGEKHPNIKTSEDLKKTLLGAKSVAFTGTGASGIYFLSVADKLGIGTQVREKAVTPEGGHIAKIVAAGDAQLGVQMKSELLGVPGAEYIGPLPPELQMNTVFTVGIFANSGNAAQAMELVRYLSAPAQAPAYQKVGMDSPK